MAYNNIKFVNEDGIGILTISRPKALNALNTETVTELNDCVGKIEADESVKVVIITGEGAKSFVAGADIVEMSTKNPVEGRKFGKISQDTFTRIENLPQPVIAAVNGYALGGGCELACACDSVMLLKTLNSVSLKLVSALHRASVVHSVSPVS